MKAIKDLVGSKKAIVFFVTVAAMSAITFGGVDATQATDFVDKLTMLAMAYLGGQGLADLGRYAGEAYASGKKAIEGRDTGRDWKGRVELAVATADDIGKKVEAVTDTDK